MLDAFPNHCVLYQGQYQSLESYPHFCMGANDKAALGGPKKKRAKKSSVKRISCHQNEDDAYTQKEKSCPIDVVHAYHR